MVVAQTAATLPLPSISTEIAASAFQVAAGVFGGIAGLIAGRQLSTIEDSEIPGGTIVVPIAIAGFSTVLGALMLPSGRELTSPI